MIILLGHTECEICGINYSDVCDVSREVGNGFLLLAQLTAEFSGLVYQIYNNVLSRHTAMILQLKLLDLLWQSFKYWLRLTLSCSVFCSKTFTVSLSDFRFCSRQTIFDSFKAKKKNQTSHQTHWAAAIILKYLQLWYIDVAYRTDLLLILNHQV